MECEKVYNRPLVKMGFQTAGKCDSRVTVEKQEYLKECENISSDLADTLESRGTLSGFLCA